jgi:hypothetical protein
MTAKAKLKRPTKRDRLREQGRWTTTKRGGQKLPHFKMPTPELQAELNEELDKTIKKRLKAAGYERICATRREHPLHSSLFIRRMDQLVGGWGSAYKTEESTQATLQRDYADIEKLAAMKAASGTPYDVEAARRESEERAERGRKDYIKRYAEGVNTYRAMLREPLMWRGTTRYYTMFPPDGPALPDEPLPKPVYVNRERPDLVIQLLDANMNLYTQVAA